MDEKYESNHVLAEPQFEKLLIADTEPIQKNLIAITQDDDLEALPGDLGMQIIQEIENSSNGLLQYISRDQLKLIKNCTYIANAISNIHHSRIRLYQWRNNKKTTGHVSLEIISSTGDYVYASYWPKIKTYIQSSPAMFATMMSDLKNEENTAPSYIDLDEHFSFELSNVNEMIKRFCEINDNPKKFWSILSDYMPRFYANYNKSYTGNCSTLVMDLLSAGKVNEYFPASAQFGSFQHLLLLSSSRIFITTSILACGIYPVIEDYIGDDARSGIAVLATLGLLFFNGITIFLVERKLTPRKFSEMNYKDCIVGMAAAFGFGSMALLDKYLERNTSFDEKLVFIFSNIKIAKAIYHVLFLAIMPLVGLYTFAKIASLLIALIKFKPFQGTPYTISPYNLAAWIPYMEKFIDVNVKKYVFRKEVSFTFILYMGWIGCAIYRQLGMRIPALEDWFQSGILALYAGIVTGVGIGYLGTKLYISSLKNELNIQLREVDKKFGQNLGRFCLTATTTSLGILGGISFCTLFNSKSVPFIGLIGIALANGVIGTLGGFFGFIIGTAIYQVIHAINKCNKSRPIIEAVETNSVTTPLLTNNPSSFYYNRDISQQSKSLSVNSQYEEIKSKNTDTIKYCNNIANR